MSDDLLAHPADRIAVLVSKGNSLPPREWYIEVINRDHSGSVEQAWFSGAWDEARVSAYLKSEYGLEIDLQGGSRVQFDISPDKVRLR